LSTIDEFQKRITKLEAEVAEIKKKIEVMELPPVVVPEEKIAEEAVEEAAIEKPKEEASEEP